MIDALRKCPPHWRKQSAGRLPVRIPLRLKKGVTSSLESVVGGDQRIPFVYFWEYLGARLTETASPRHRHHTTVSVTAPSFTNHHHYHPKPPQMWTYHPPATRVSDLELPEVLE